MPYKVGSSLLLLDAAASYTATHTTPTLSGQACSVYIPGSDPGYPPVLFTHQASGDQTFIDGSFMRPIVDYLTGRGFVCAASNLHGDNWGNDAAITDLENLLAHIDSNSNADVTRVYFVGLSMGMVTAASYLRNGTADVLAVASLVGCCDLDYMHDSVAFTAAIDNAYGSEAAYLAAFNTRDPQTLAAAGYFAGVPVGMWWGSSDTTAGATQSQTFQATAPLAEFRHDVQAHFGIGLMHGPSAGSWLIKQHTALARTRTLLV